MNSQVDIKALSRLYTPYTTARIVLDWLTIILAIYYSELSSSLFVTALCIILIGSRMHALGILSHELVHHRYLKNRKASDFIGNLFLCWPLFFTLEGYRAQHLRHHHQLNTDEDPDFYRRVGDKQWQFPMRRSEFLWMLFKDLSGLNILQYPKKIFTVKTNNKKLAIKESYLTKFYILKMSLFYIFVASLISYFSAWDLFFLYWILPIATSLKLIKRIRAIAEHFAVPRGEFEEVTRTVIATPFESYLIAPHNVAFHTEHHRYSSVPFYNLDALHKKALQNGELNKWGHITHGYLNGLIKEASQSPMEVSPSSPVAIR
ncbi:MAG: fatty acid desaturase family protein [Bdellovibrionota bacterium]|nr:fatty acid desaturase family protein [Bdellovibrionota bacterium]